MLLTEPELIVEQTYHLCSNLLHFQMRNRVRDKLTSFKIIVKCGIDERLRVELARVC